MDERTEPAAATPKRPRPLADLPAAALRSAIGLMTDIDDTLTRGGAIEAPALAALRTLRERGVPVIAITGRPLGWSEPFARIWPLAALVAENGAVALIPEGSGLRTEFAQDAATRAYNTLRLQAAAARVLREVPGTALSRDSPGRVTDIAIDHSEHARLDAATVARVVAVMQAEGLNATVSSIHVNGWFGDHDKWSAARWMVRRLLGRDLEGELDRWVYVGDSTNDQALFARFPLSIGVANLMRFADQLHTWPAFLARGERGEGFAEVAAALLASRGGPDA